MNEDARDIAHVQLEVTPKELKYFVACGLALVQNVPAKSLATYCGLTKDEIIQVSKRLKKVADDLGII